MVAVLAMKTIVVGLGNPILGDDGVGWKVAEEVKRRLTSPSPPTPLPQGEGDSVEVETLSLGGIGLMEHLIGFDRAIIVDAFTTDAPVGSISVLKLSQLPNYSAFHIASAHDTSLQNALELGRTMGAPLPDEVMVVGIATECIHEFNEDLSPPVTRAVPSVVRIVLDLLNEYALNKAEESHPQG
jgi:hydrogenase maturation protease